MRPVAFREQNTTWAKNQPEYLPLPAYSNDERTITCWRLTWRERLTVLFTGRVWCSLLNQGRPLQPQLLEVRSPFTSLADSLVTWTATKRLPEVDV